MNRREFVAGTGASLLCAAADLRAATPVSKRICAFDKPLASLDNEELAAMLGTLGFAGVEASVRAGGRVLPERVEDDLPRLRDVLAKRGVEISIIATDINSANQPHAEKVLRTAAKLGIRHYRMAWYRYDLSKPILPQLDDIAAKLPALVDFKTHGGKMLPFRHGLPRIGTDLTREIGMTAIYQNHSGADTVGAPIWDIFSVLKNYDPRTIGIGFDIHHAKVEGGLSWPIQFKLVQSHLAAVYVKDFVWDHGAVKDVPLGEGVVGRKFFDMLRQTDFDGPICLHVEYLEGEKNGEVIENALRKDLKTLRSLLG
jgi:sugar phosphate isomerase/epimerase